MTGPRNCGSISEIRARSCPVETARTTPSCERARKGRGPGCATEETADHWIDATLRPAGDLERYRADRRLAGRVLPGPIHDFAHHAISAPPAHHASPAR